MRRLRLQALERGKNLVPHGNVSHIAVALDGSFETLARFEKAEGGFGDEEVLGSGHRVLQEPVDQDDIRAGQLLEPPDAVAQRDALVGDHLQGQMGHVVAGATTAGVGPSEVQQGGVERLDEGVELPADEAPRLLPGPRRAGLGGDEDGVPLELVDLQRDLQLADDGPEEVADDALAVRQGRPVRQHEPGIAADVREEQNHLAPGTLRHGVVAGIRGRTSGRDFHAVLIVHRLVHAASAPCTPHLPPPYGEGVTEIQRCSSEMPEEPIMRNPTTVATMAGMSTQGLPVVSATKATAATGVL